MSALGLLDDVQVADWSQGMDSFLTNTPVVLMVTKKLEHPQLQFISHIPAKVHGEQLVSQFCRSIPGQQWMFQYGRVPLDLIMSDSLWLVCSKPSSLQDIISLTILLNSVYQHPREPAPAANSAL